MHIPLMAARAPNRSGNILQHRARKLHCQLFLVAILLRLFVPLFCRRHHRRCRGSILRRILPRARSSSPPNNYDETYYGASAPAMSSASTHTSSDEYPSSVQELVMNGFELSKVLHAYDLIGDNFDDLLSFLLSSTS